ncbi:MED6-domain-containing protein [Basidiobolus meristosporus CBS 931.73]|uniref:Mediator of RNA polymerase II transcription subunit 6 n=1 Tax=Basidiobolus meristosporus CBS 931.73 TaxID=1314790 RepID=A0A1Y1XWR7_9FUNG|nr:MED6-domain-containing protein [Basidiobolus meristosporus CBS 931.73]|eukprot:ORX90201.1 MED6-domain-containing protein [Basidiobolus meristosporus CBS 931.73]
MEEDLTNLEWRFSEWLVQAGGLNPQNVLEYFSLSPYWDPESNNAILKMQTQFNELEPLDMKLREMTGIEFVLAHERWPVLFVIRKQRRRSPDEAIPIATYYIINGNIYQSPDLYSVMANRMLTSLTHLQSAFREAHKFAEFHPSRGYSWKIETEKSQNPSGQRDNPGGSLLRQQEVKEYRSCIDRAIYTAGIKLPTEQTNDVSNSKKAGLTLTSIQSVMSKAAMAAQKAQLELAEQQSLKRKKRPDQDLSSLRKKKKKKSD